MRRTYNSISSISETTYIYIHTNFPSQTVDTNSAFFAKYCFSLGITLKRIEVIADDESEIIEAARRMSANYDFVVTTGGIGPTHDDITYQSIARAFDLPLVLHEVAYEKMKKLSRPHPSNPTFDWNVDSPARTATGTSGCWTAPSTPGRRRAAR